MLTNINCPHCQTSIRIGSDVCPHCGQELCPECAAPLSPDAASCAACGAEFAVFCSHCDGQVEPDTAVCPHCSQPLDGTEETAELETNDAFTGQCPICDTPLYIEDGFCAECGATFCGRCGRPVDDDDDICPHCLTLLYFECPLCRFALTAGTDLCPNCNALFPAYCSHCRTILVPGVTQCPKCETAVHISQRSSARIIHTLLVEDTRLVHVVACPGCGTQFNPVEGDCRECGYRVCPGCQISLEETERICPRCGFNLAPLGAEESDANTCPTCGRAIAAGSDECPHCQQLLCPECLTAVADDDAICQQCGAEFELICPQCQAIVSAEADACPECGLAF